MNAEKVYLRLMDESRKSRHKALQIAYELFDSWRPSPEQKVELEGYYPELRRHLFPWFVLAVIDESSGNEREITAIFEEKGVEVRDD